MTTPTGESGSKPRASRRPSQQRRWDAHFDHLLRIVRRAERDPTKAVVTAFARTEAQYGQRPTNEEKP